MFKRNLLKRTLPIMLSVAMTLQSVPITAMAAENPPTAVETEAAEPEAQAEPGGGPVGEPAAEVTAESAAETAEETPEESAPEAAEETSGTSEETVDETPAQPEETPAQETENTSDGASGEESAPTEDAAVSGTETEGDGQETAGTVTETENEAEVSADESAETTADGAGENEGPVTPVIYVPDDVYSLWEENEEMGFTLQKGESDRIYTGVYTPDNHLDTIKGWVEDYTEIQVNGVEQSGLETYFSIKWQTKSGENWTDMLETPENVGSYRLALEVAKVDNLCEAAVPVYIYFDITQKELAFDDSKVAQVKAGDKIEDFKADVKENGEINGIDKLQYSLDAVAVYKVGEEGETKDIYFSKDADYYYKVTATLVDSIKDNYKLDAETEYRIAFDNALRKTEVEVKRTNPGVELAKEYVKDGTGWKTEDFLPKDAVTVTLKVESKDKAEDGSQGTVFVEAGEAEKTELGEPVAKWYTKETFAAGSYPNEIDEKTQFRGKDAEGKDTNDLYTLLQKDTIPPEDTILPEDTISKVGEYYIVYVCDGKEDKFDSSHSDPIQVTINPISVILKPESADALKFGMDETAVSEVLAKVTSGLYRPTDAMTVGSKEEGVGKVEDGFYGVSYDDADKTQYYSPVFELRYRRKAKATATAPAATEWTWVKDTLTTLENEPGNKLDNERYDYEFYIVFTGKKAVYNAEGKKVGKDVDITETSTNTAVQDYKVVADEAVRLNELNALSVNIGDAETTTINVQRIISAFNEEHGYDYKDSGYAAADSGVLAKPARMVYAPDASLFARDDGIKGYKQADVKGKDGNNITVNRATELTYTWWQFTGATNDYYKFIYMTEPADQTSEEYKEWKNLKDKLESAYTSPTGTPTDAGIYRLKVEYNDEEKEYASSEGYAYFLIEKQELVLKADTQYAEYGQVNSQLYNWHGYSIYEVTGNDASKVSTEALDWDADNIFDDEGDPVAKWEAMTLNKDSNGNDIADDWRVMGYSDEFIKNTDHPYTYRAAVYFNPDPSGIIIKKSTGENATNNAGKALNWSNYTTRNQDDWDAEENEYRQHKAGFGDILFERTELTLTVNGTVPADREYNGLPIADANPLTVITSAGDALVANEGQDAVSGVKLGWRWTTIGQDGDDNYWPNKVVTTQNAIYGGTYTLVASFKGNDTYKALNGYGEWQEILDKDGKPYSFTIKKRKVEITPKLKKTVTAGNPLREILEEGIDYTGIAAGDDWLFESHSGVRKDVTGATDREVEYDGYAILQSGKFVQKYFANNKETTGDKLIRFGKNYTVELSYTGLFAQYALSYDITYKAAPLEQIVRGDADVWSVGFYDDGLDGRADKDYVEVDGKKVSEDPAPHEFKIKALEGIPFIYDSYKIQKMVGERGGEDDEGNPNEQPADIPKELSDEISLEKHYIAVDIVSPREFSDEIEDNANYGAKQFLYETSIKNAGGYVIGTRRFVEDLSDDDYWKGEYYRYRITALFPVERDENGKAVNPKSFAITWEKGYTETFTWDLETASLEANLKEAVAPKSIAFNAPAKKMAVGEEQQLDVKIKKMQLGDVIRVNYSITEGTDYAYVDPETGRITALSKGPGKSASVTVKAYPVRLGEDGKTFEEITTDAKGKAVKPATTKITITEVTAPAIKKLVAEDDTVTVQYTKVNDGYRREIYVVDISDANGNIDKNEAAKWKTAQNFNDRIRELKNGQWKGTFAIAPKYCYGTEGYDSKLKLCIAELESLNMNASYAVYVRNVSAVRTLADGHSKVEESAAGTVKTIKTTKSKVKGLRLYFGPEDETVDYIDEKDPSKGYIVDFQKKSAQVLVNGFFSKKALDNAQDDKDLEIPLPIKKYVKAASQNPEFSELLTQYPDIATKYMEPKLSYYITDGDAGLKFDDKGKLTNPSKYATIAKNGKITFKGVGENGVAKVTIYAVPDNKIQNQYIALRGRCKLVISAAPDTARVKKAKAVLKVGDGIRLADYLEYKQNGKKLLNYWSSNIDITNWEQVEAAGFEIHRIGDGGEKEQPNADGTYSYASVNGSLNKGEYIITAIKPNASCTLEFEDGVYNGDGESTVKFDGLKIALSSTKLDPVKGLKTAYADDKHITLNFTYAGHPDAFVIEVKDARNSVIYKRLAYVRDCETVYAEDVAKDKAPWLQNEQTGIIGDPLKYYYDNDCFKYFEKTKKYAYTVKTEKLLRLSSYTITVEPVFNGQSASEISGGKPATAKAKTTNIPASYGNADITDPKWQYTDYVTIEDAYHENSIEGWYFISGNTYTLKVGGDLNDAAMNRGTDTLTWKSSNTKVLSLKANPGSYSATLKAMQQGRATITVTSKITKKTIARYHVAVKAVGDGKNFGGDFEYGGGINGSQTPFYDKLITTYDPYYEGKLEVLTVTNPVHVTEDELLNYPGLNGDVYEWEEENHNRTWVQFTAPAYGQYTFFSNKSGSYYYGDKSGLDGSFTWSSYEDQNGNKRRGYGLDCKLEKGQKIYFKVSGEFKLEVLKYTDFTKLTEGKPIKVTKDTWVSFTAATENYYTFTGGSRFEQDGKDVTDNMSGNDNGGQSIGLKAGETIFILVEKGQTLSVEKRDLSKSLENGENTVSFGRDKEGSDQYLYRTFKAAATGDYTFAYPAEYGENVEVKFYSVDGKEIPENTGVTAKTLALDTEGTLTPPQKEKILFIEEGQTIVIAIMVKDAAFEKAETFDVKITVSSNAIGTEDTLKAGTTVEKGTSKTFAYTVTMPTDTKTAQYTVKAEDATITWYDASYKDISGYFNGNRNSSSFVVEDGAVRDSDQKIKVNDKIYIKVDAKDATENVAVSISEKTVTSVNAPAANVAAPLSNGSEQWYTFAVKKAGYYEFTYDLGEAPKHGITIEEYENAFDDDPISYYYDPIEFAEASAERLYKLTAGSHTFKVAASGTAEGTTNATLSVKDVFADAVPMNAGGNDVKLESKSEVKYYSFKADSEYTIKWAPDKDTGSAVVGYMRDNDYSFTTLYAESEIKMSPNVTYYFRAKWADNNDKAVTGKLQVTGEAEKITLNSGVAKKFTFKDGDSAIQYQFTTPKDNDLGYAVIVENTSTSEVENGPVPTINVGYPYYPWYSNSWNNLGKGKHTLDLINGYWQSAYQTKIITVSASGMTDKVDATGTITVQPITPETFTEQIGKIVQDDSKWYAYTVPADGRYSLSYQLVEGQTGGVNLSWYKKNGSSTSQIGGLQAQYFKKDETIYVNVQGTNVTADAGVDVTLSLKAIEPGKLELAADKDTAEVDLTNETPDYYTFTAPADAAYTVDGYYGNLKWLVPKNGQEDFSNGGELKVGETILIPVRHSGKLTVTKELIETLELGKPSSGVKLATGKSASFAFTSYTDDYFDFTTSVQENITVEVSGSTSIIHEDSGYALIKGSANKRLIIKVINYSGKEAELTITAKQVDPVKLELDKDVPVPAEKGRISLLTFRAPETYRYTVTCGEGGQIIEADVTGNEVWSPKEKLRLLKLQYSGEANTATINVKVAKLQPEKMEEGKAEVHLKNNESQWFAYTVPKAGKYTFNASGSAVYAELYSDMRGSGYTGGSNPSVTKAADDVIYVKVEGENDDAEPKTEISFEFEEFKYELKMGETLEVNESGSSEYQYVIFKAPYDGFYQFSYYPGPPVEEYGEYVYYVGDEPRRQGGEALKNYYYDNNSPYKFFIAEGDEVFFRVYNSDWTMYIDVEDGLKTGVATELKLGKSGDQSVSGNDLTKDWYTFTAPENGTYSFMQEDREHDGYANLYLYTSGDVDSVGYNESDEVYNAIGTDYYYDYDDEYERPVHDGQFGIREFYLAKGQKVYLGLKWYETSGGSYTFNIQKND